MKKPKILSWDILLFSQIFGVFPLKYTKKSNKTLKLEYCPKLALWGICFATFLSVMTYIMILIDLSGHFNGNAIRMGNTVGVVTILMDVLSLQMMTSVVATVNIRKYAKYLKMSSILEKIDKTLNLEIRNPPTLLKVLFAFSFITILILWSIVMRTDEDPRVALYIPPACCYYVQAALLLQFTFIAKILALRFKLINEKIEKELKGKASWQYSNDLSLNHDSSGASTADRIGVMFDCYAQLHKAAQLAQSFYCSQLLFAFISSFLHNTVTLYFLVSNIKENGFVVANILREGVWVVGHLGHLILLVLPSSEMVEAASETASTVILLMNTDLQDEEVTDELESFLLKLTFYNVGFSGQGFFQINKEILISMASSVSTYLIALFEFDKH